MSEWHQFWAKIGAAVLAILAGAGLIYLGAHLFTPQPETSLLWSVAPVVILTIVGASIVSCGVALSAHAAGQLFVVSAVYRALRTLLSSSIFYIALGCLFLFTAYHSLGRVHSAFVFLLAIMGVAIVLFGTGTEAAGTGSTGRIKVAIAGGAGVLAAVFGFGVMNYANQIQKVFEGQVDYGEVTISNKDVESLDFRKDYDVSAELANGTRLHLWRQRKTIDIVVPIHHRTSETNVIVNLNPREQYKDRDDDRPKKRVIDWSKTASKAGQGNERVRHINWDLSLKQLPPVRPRAGGQFVIKPQ